MLIFNTLFMFLLSMTAFGFDADFKILPERAPHEFVLLIESMKDQARKPSKQIELIGLCQEINENLKTLGKEHIYILLKTEISKGVLEYKFDKTRTLNVNSILIDNLENDLTNKEKFYTPFAKWIAFSILAELKTRRESGIITTNSFNPNSLNGTKKDEALRFQRYLNYLYPWLGQVMRLNTAEFNLVVDQVSYDVLKKILARSKFFKLHSSSVFGVASENIFNIPHKYTQLAPSDIKKMQKDEIPESLTLTEQSKIEKAEAEKTMDKVTPLDMSTLSDDVANELDKKTAPAP